MHCQKRGKADRHWTGYSAETAEFGEASQFAACQTPARPAVNRTALTGTNTTPVRKANREFTPSLKKSTGVRHPSGPRRLRTVVDMDELLELARRKIPSASFRAIAVSPSRMAKASTSLISDGVVGLMDSACQPGCLRTAGTYRRAVHPEVPGLGDGHLCQKRRPHPLTTNPTSPIQRRKCRNWLIYRCRRQKVGTTERLVKRTGVGSLR